MPDLRGDYFDQCLTYVCEHDEHGAMGLMINRPTNTTFSEFFAELGYLNKDTSIDRTVIEGGPVAPQQGFVLHSTDMTFDSTFSLQVTNQVAMTTSTDCIREIAAGRAPRRYLIALGYVGWGAGQLESELDRSLWLATPANLEVLFDTPMEEKLQAAGNLLGFDFRLMSRPGNA